MHLPTVRSVCIGCEQTERTERTRENRYLQKARDTLRRHSLRLGIAVQILVDDYGWDVRQMAHDIEHASLNGCPYCRDKFSEMGHGLADITLDIVDRVQPPFYATNCRWVCMTCNREKSRTAPQVWAERLVFWPRYEAMRRKRNFGLPLFAYFEPES